MVLQLFCYISRKCMFPLHGSAEQAFKVNSHHFHIQKTVPSSASNRLFMWRQSRNFWFVEICVIHKNPLSERSELWIFANAFSRFRQALKFRPAATESRLDADGGTSCEIQNILFYLISPQVHSHLHKPHPQKAA